MARVLDGRFTARIDEPFVVFLIGVMLHYRCGLGGAGSAVPGSRS
jgi:hypothetical protein